MTRCLLALGANLGDRAESLDRALDLLARIPGIQLLARSSWFETTPVGGVAEQPGFLNGAALIDARHLAEQLISDLHSVESSMGRERQIRWAARTLDIDLLLFGDTVTNTAGLQIPHPRMSFRQFVLTPASEIAGDMIHPTSGWTINALSRYWRTASRKVAIACNDQHLEQSLHKAISEQLCSHSSDVVESRRIELVAMDQSPSMIIVVGDTESLRRCITAQRLPASIVQISTPDNVMAIEEALAAVQAAWPA